MVRGAQHLAIEIEAAENLVSERLEKQEVSILTIIVRNCLVENADQVLVFDRRLLSSIEQFSKDDHPVFFLNLLIN